MRSADKCPGGVTVPSFATVSFAVSPNRLCVVFGNSGRLCDDLLENPSRDVCETEVAPLEPGCQPRVVQAEQAQHGRVKIVDVHAVARGREAKLVGFADGLSRLHSAAG